MVVRQGWVLRLSSKLCVIQTFVIGFILKETQLEDTFPGTKIQGLNERSGLLQVVVLYEGSGTVSVGLGLVSLLRQRVEMSCSVH